MVWSYIAISFPMYVVSVQTILILSQHTLQALPPHLLPLIPLLPTSLPFPKYSITLSIIQTPTTLHSPARIHLSMYWRKLRLHRWWRRHTRTVLVLYSLRRRRRSGLAVELASCDLVAALLRNLVVCRDDGRVAAGMAFEGRVEGALEGF
jgi:hypothetical protein